MTVVFAHELTVFLVALWGYTALLLTNEFNTPVLLACYGLAAAAFVARRKRIEAPRWLWNIVSLIALVLALGMATRQLLDATVYLFLFLQVVKLFTARTALESRWSYIIALFQVIGASVLTTSMTFGLVFVVYVLLMIFSLLLYTLRRESEMSERLSEGLYARVLEATHGRTTRPRLRIPWALRARLPRGLAWSSALLTFLVMLATVLTFAVVPRLATQNLFQGYGKPPEKPSLSAFDESVEFGTFEKIQLDDQLAMFVQPLQNVKQSHIRLRGVALDTFDGRAWRRTTASGFVNGTFQFRPFTTRVYAEQNTYRIIQPPGITNYLFGETFPESVKVPNDFGYYADNLSNAAWLGNMQPKEFQYQCQSRPEELDARKDPAKEALQQRPTSVFSTSFMGTERPYGEGGWRRREMTSDILERRAARWPGRTLDWEMLRYLDRCTTLPVLLNTKRIRDLAGDWTGQSDTTFSKALAIETRLRRDYRYSLEPKARGNFIEDFLLRTKEGHCEYFATSMAVLLRSLSIPARVVNGYYCVEWNAIGNNFTVRQKDAHSWVEAWLSDDYGWMTFDPTPPAGVGRAATGSPVTAQVSRFVDALRVRWYRYVVDYSINDQAAVMRTIADARDRISKFFERFQQKIWLPQFGGSDSNPRSNTFINLLAALILAGAAVGATLWALRHLKPSRRRRRAETMVRYYGELLKLLGAKGFRLATGETPREFANRLSSMELMAPFAPITEMYYGSRYEGRALSEQELAEIESFRSAVRSYKPGLGIQANNGR